MTSIHKRPHPRPRSWADRLSVFTTLVIGATTLFPYQFMLPPTTELFLDYFSIPWVSVRSMTLDLAGNVLLFAPLGFGLAWFYSERTELRRTPMLLLVLISCAGVSSVIEGLQVFLPSRHAAPHDILMNASGGAIGCLLFRRIGEPLIGSVETCLARVAERARPWPWRAISAVLFVGYLGFAASFTAYLQRRADFASWDESYRLLLGNEATADRQWRGRVFDVQISGRTVSPDEAAQARSSGDFRLGEPLLFDARWKEAGSFEDRIGLVPPLSWTQEPPPNEPLPQLEDGRWLLTGESAKPLTAAVRESNQLSIYAHVSTASMEQEGPARILSFSADPFHRNFMLGQEKTDLVFRLRTGATNDNGRPQLVVPGVFSTTAPLHIVVTYDGACSRAYVDGIKQPAHIEHNPGALLFARFFKGPAAWDNVEPSEFAGCKVIYYGLAFLPLGALLLLVTRNRRTPVAVSGGILGIIAPAVFVEGLVVYASGKSWNSGSFLLACAMTLIGFLLAAYASGRACVAAEPSLP